MAMHRRVADTEAEAGALRAEILEMLRFPSRADIRERLIKELGLKTYKTIYVLMTCPDEGACDLAIALYGAHVLAAHFQRCRPTSQWEQ